MGTDRFTSLQGRFAVVTGASRGIGAAIAHSLSENGTHVALISRDVRALKSVAASLPGPSTVVRGDLAQVNSAELIVKEIRKVTDTVDILVNNAAAATRTATTDLTADILDEMLSVNVRNLLLLTARLIPFMLTSRGASIINVSSISGLLGTPKRAAYAATKGAVDALTRSLAQEYGLQGIRVNAIAPGIADTALWAKNKSVPGVEAAMNKHIPLGRWGSPEELAAVVAFLASDSARYVTAQTISVDGGMADTLDLYAGPI
ncbi:MAG: SDR family oxidoreductase [Acidimicrobiaceae bacterium]|nr:SDR family oxidoreductase [Acidimicrobiaceae bacterium]